MQHCSNCNTYKLMEQNEWRLKRLMRLIFCGPCVFKNKKQIFCTIYQKKVSRLAFLASVNLF